MQEKEKTMTMTDSRCSRTWNDGHGAAQAAAQSTVRSGDLSLTLNGTGDLAAIRLGDLQISQYLAGEHDASVCGLWLRHHTARGLDVAPLTGARARGTYQCVDGRMRWDGQALGVRWSVELRPCANGADGADSGTGAGSSGDIDAAGNAGAGPTGDADSTSEAAPTVDAAWTWTVAIRPLDAAAPVDPDAGLWDIVTAQDLALAPIGQALTSEPYISQYVAFHAHDDEGIGPVLAARQTMACAPQLPLFVTAIAEGGQGYMTDGFDFYGREARLGGEPRALRNADWSGERIDQYEFAMACLQARPRPMNDILVWHVVSVVSSDYRGEMGAACRRFADGLARRHSADAADAAAVAEAGTVLQSDDPHDDAPAALVSDPVPAEPQDTRRRASLLATSPLLNGDEPDDGALAAMLGGAPISPEYDDAGHLLSCFSDRARHLVSRAKELLVDRSHGQILLCGDVIDPERSVLATTTYAPGVFASHVVLGNTNMHRLISVHHTSLNLLRSQGVRILVRSQALPRTDHAAGTNGWRMLGVPSAYIMELGGSRWIYRLGDATVIVDTTASAEDDHIVVALRSSVAMDVMATMDVETADHWTASARFDDDLSGVVLAPAAGTAPADACPGLRYAMASPDATLEDDDAALFADGLPQGSGVLVFRAEETTSMHLIMAAGMQGDQAVGDLASASCRTAMDGIVTGGSGLTGMHLLRSDPWRERMLTRHFETITGFARGLHVHGDGRLSEFNLVMPWFMQNALVHFLSPHGLEQYSGAAWGTRDVCQGPLEAALAFGHYDIVREILLKVFAHQNADGSLPQWFMFDAYASMYQHDSHGDIPVWPLMAVAEYLGATGDHALLGRTVGFWDTQADRPCETASTVADHLERTLDYIRTHRVPGTALFSYGEGDWDDTLQPAQASMKKDMASTWTIALLYQATRALSERLPHDGDAPAQRLADAFGQEAETIHTAFARDFIFDGVLAGYVSFRDGMPMPLIHPDDRHTGIRYRLIPMTRSIIAGLLDAAGERRHESIIDEHLHYPDGVRLMSQPAAFHDGVTTVFKRAEQAANIGREIGLMYTHAHIRYSEALGLLGRETLGRELLRISPVGQFARLATSELRQRNCYFASSDADFPDRTTAAAQWDRLRDGAADPVGVRGGWRVYSSGPGIYLRQMMQHLFGIQLHTDRVVFDPVLEAGDDGTVIDVALFGTMRHIRYRVVDGAVPVEVSVGGRSVVGDRVALPYRQGGISVSAALLGDAEDLTVTVGTARVAATKPAATNSATTNPTVDAPAVGTGTGATAAATSGAAGETTSTTMR